MIKLNLVAYYQFYQLSTKTTYAIGPVSSDGLSGWVRYDILVIFWVGSSDPLGKVLQMIRTHPKGNRLEHALNQNLTAMYHSCLFVFKNTLFYLTGILSRKLKSRKSRISDSYHIEGCTRMLVKDTCMSATFKASVHSLIEREIRFNDPPTHSTQLQPTQSSYQPIQPPTNLPTIPPTIDEKEMISKLELA